ncbi:endonuclease domain-containing protein [Flavisolibacter tropicus]|uniref:endonuclease domain-containing protein n=1 Tax=Flavisolibacter tropicus TaxID=1492898 RepID=UPI00082B50E1|nr:endonuclease domain-containing protein [Flavisolibacter tropicus]
MVKNKFEERLNACKVDFHAVVPVQKTDKLLRLDFTANNTELTPEILSNTILFSEYVDKQLKQAGATYGIGGYNEHRTIYSRSEVFDGAAPSVAPPCLPEGDDLNAQGQLEEDDEEDLDSLLGEREGSYGCQWADPFYYKQLKEYALSHRKQPTHAEAVLWYALKGRQLGGYRFRQQHIIDKYIADFVCLGKRLIIEVDGLIHQLPDNKESGQARSEALIQKGFTVIRFTNDQVLHQKDQVLQTILLRLSQLPSIKEQSDLSSPFGGKGAEPRRLHLGTDIWGPVDTPIYAPLAGTVHSVGFNDAYGDYGATLILQHEINGLIFHTLYGHLSLNSIQDKQQGQEIEKGAWIASFGDIAENGNWPPHLHFQLILDMQGYNGDYPGVCRFSERESYLYNCPNPELILGMEQFVL